MDRGVERTARRCAAAGRAQHVAGRRQRWRRRDSPSVPSASPIVFKVVGRRRCWPRRSSGWCRAGASAPVPIPAYNDGVRKRMLHPLEFPIAGCGRSRRASSTRSRASCCASTRSAGRWCSSSLGALVARSSASCSRPSAGVSKGTVAGIVTVGALAPRRRRCGVRRVGAAHDRGASRTITHGACCLGTAIRGTRPKDRRQGVRRTWPPRATSSSNVVLTDGRSPGGVQRSAPPTPSTRDHGRRAAPWSTSCSRNHDRRTPTAHGAPGHVHRPSTAPPASSGRLHHWRVNQDGRQFLTVQARQVASRQQPLPTVHRARCRRPRSRWWCPDHGPE